MICPDCDNPGCRHGGCQGRFPLNRMPPRDPLPRPEVNVTTSSEGKTHVVISRDGKGKSYEIAGSTATEQVRDAVRQVINDGHTAEWLP